MQQAKLRADHLRKQREILVANQETLTIGEAGLLAELKLANDVLRSQLQHRNHIIHEQQCVIQVLKEQLNKYSVEAVDSPTSSSTPS